MLYKIQSGKINSNNIEYLNYTHAYGMTEQTEAFTIKNEL